MKKMRSLAELRSVISKLETTPSDIQRFRTLFKSCGVNSKPNVVAVLYAASHPSRIKPLADAAAKVSIKKIDKQAPAPEVMWALSFAYNSYQAAIHQKAPFGLHVVQRSIAEDSQKAIVDLANIVFLQNPAVIPTPSPEFFERIGPFGLF
jgi:hypothetical protein